MTAAIISASRRTDIPAFYGEWFRNRRKAGFCEVRNPFSHARYRVSLARTDVLGWVFWSRDYAPFLDTLRELHAEGQRFLCHFTINGLPRAIEPRTPEVSRAIDAAHAIAEAFGPDVIQWRYDPVILTTITPPEWHRGNFASLAGRMAGAARRCLFSFPEMYQKTRRNLAALEAAGQFRVWTPSKGDFTSEDLAALALDIARIARSRDMQAHSCCNPQWVDAEGLIQPARCVDWSLLSSLLPPGDLPRVPPHPTRKTCNCDKSIDIGRYHTCAHGCAYCYAVDNPGKALDNRRFHEPENAQL